MIESGKAASLTEEVRSWVRFAADPPAAARQALEDFEPGWTALCLLSAFALVGRYCGRESLGGRTRAMTALNPRFSGGLKTIAKGVPDLPLELLQGTTMRGIDVGAAAAGLESLLLDAADAHRHGSAYTMSGVAPPAHSETLQLTGGPDELRVAGPDRPWWASWIVGRPRWAAWFVSPPPR